MPPVRHCVVDTVQYQASIGKGLKYLQVPIYRCLLDIANGMVYLHSMAWYTVCHYQVSSVYVTLSASPSCLAHHENPACSMPI